jgi:hypothetical protein
MEIAKTNYPSLLFEKEVIPERLRYFRRKRNTQKLNRCSRRKRDSKEMEKEEEHRRIK